MINLNEMQKVAELATPGPWEMLNQRSKFFIDSEKTRRTPNGRIADIQWFSSEAAGPLRDESKANAHHISACDPDTIIKLIEVAQAAKHALMVLEMVAPNSPATERLERAMEGIN